MMGTGERSRSVARGKLACAWLVGLGRRSFIPEENFMRRVQPLFSAAGREAVSENPGESSLAVDLVKFS
jgi:hypothetical protein